MCAVGRRLFSLFPGRFSSFSVFLIILAISLRFSCRRDRYELRYRRATKLFEDVKERQKLGSGKERQIDLATSR